MDLQTGHLEDKYHAPITVDLPTGDLEDKYHAPITVDLPAGHLEDKYHAPIISLLLFTMKFYGIIFRNNFCKKLLLLFCILASGNQALLKGVLL